MAILKNVFFLGLGAIGAKYASMFYDHDPSSVYVIVDNKRKQKYKEDGFYINRRQYTFQYVTEPPTGVSVDLIILGVKSTEVEEALASIKPFVQPDTIILSLLNGINNTQVINDFFKQDLALYSIVYMDAVKKGNSITFGHPGIVVFGEKYNMPLSDRVKSVSTLFDKYSIQYEVSDDMILTLWRKYLINVVGNQLTFILDVGYEGLQDNPYVLKLVQEIGQEVITIANAQGIGLEQSDIDNMIETMRKLPAKAMTSMHQDRLNGRKSEVEIFAGEMIRLGKKFNIQTPYNLMLYNLIKAFEWERDYRR